MAVGWKIGTLYMPGNSFTWWFATFSKVDITWPLYVRSRIESPHINHLALGIQTDYPWDNCRFDPSRGGWPRSFECRGSHGFGRFSFFFMNKKWPHRVDRRTVVVWKLFVFVLLCVCFFECWWTCPPEMSLFLDETDQTGWQNFPKFMVFCFFFGGLESFHAQRFFMRVTFITVFHPMEILDFVEPWLVDTVLILFNTYLYNLDPSPPVTVTRIITFLVGDINLCHFCHCYWVGVDLIYDYDWLCYYPLRKRKHDYPSWNICSRCKLLSAQFQGVW